MDKDFKKRFEYLKRLRAADEITKQERGRYFEALILDIFEHHGILIRRSYHTSDNKREQIDGAIEFCNQIALVEVKWKESNIAASELYSFCGKIDNKFFGTIGVFISKEELSDNFVTSLNKGRKQNVIVLHGDDVVSLLELSFPFKEYLTEVRRVLSTENVNHISTKRFIQEYTSKDDESTLITKVSDHCKKLLTQTLSKKTVTTDSLLIDIEAKCNNEDKQFILEYLLREVKNLNFDIVYMPAIERRHRIFQIVNRLLENENALEKSWPIFFDELKKTPRNYLREDLFEKYQEKIDRLEGSERKEFCGVLIDAWKTLFDDWNAENILAVITDRNWGKLENGQKRELRKLLFEILCSGRRENFPQKKFARRVLERESDTNGKSLGKEIFNWIKAKIENEKMEFQKIEGDFKIDSEFIAKSYEEMRKILKMKEHRWSSKIEEIYKSVYGS